MVRGGRGTKQPGLAVVGRHRISRVEMESQRFLIGWGPRADAVDRRDGHRNEGDGPVGRSTKHFWRRPLLPSGVREDSRARSRTGSHLVRARRLSHWLRARRGCTGFGAKGRPRPGLLAGCTVLSAVARTGTLVY